MPLYSHSRLGAFETCPLKYKYHYIDKMCPDEELEGIEAFLGSRFHESFERAYFNKKNGKVMTLDEVYAFFDKKWRENWSEGVQIVREGLEPKDYYNKGRQMIKDYYERVFVNDDAVTIALEKRVLVDLGEGYKLQGYIDRLACAKNGVYEVHDYKTGGHLPTQKEIDEDRQLALYQAGVQSDYADAKRVKLVWHYVAFNKDLESKRSKKAITQVKKEAVAVIKRIERAEARNDFPAVESALCDWCGFLALCPKHKHALRVEFLKENEFAKDSGVQLATKYAELKAKEKEIASKLDELKEAVFAFAKKEGIEVIIGKDCKLKVKLSKVERLPAKGTEEREKLDELVKKSGKWVEVSDLSQALLKQALEEGVFDSKMVRAIEGLQRLEEEGRIYLSALKE